jgi:hypothetical protein
MKTGKWFRTWREGEPAAVRERLLRYLASQNDTARQAAPNDRAGEAAPDD